MFLWIQAIIHLQASVLICFSDLFHSRSFIVEVTQLFDLKPFIVPPFILSIDHSPHRLYLSLHCIYLSSMLMLFKFKLIRHYHNHFIKCPIVILN